MGEESPNSGNDCLKSLHFLWCRLKLVSKGRGCGLAQAERLSDLQAFSGTQGSECCLHRVKVKCGIGAR